MIRQTSIDSFNRIRAGGLLSPWRLLVYECLYHHGPMTQRECYTKISQEEGNPKLDHQTIAPRFAELQDRGVIQCVGKSVCRISGKTCMIWDVTSGLPVEPPKKKTTEELLREQNRRLQDRINFLESVLA